MEYKYVKEYTIEEFFKHFSWINKTELSIKIGISPSIMRQYACGRIKPSKKRLQEIQEKIRELAKDLLDSELYIPGKDNDNNSK